MAIQQKVGKEYISVEAKPGSRVAIFAPTRLNNALKRAVIGDRIWIKYMGEGKPTKFGGKPHEFQAEVL